MERQLAAGRRGVDVLRQGMQLDAAFVGGVLDMETTVRKLLIL